MWRSRISGKHFIDVETKYTKIVFEVAERVTGAGVKNGRKMLIMKSREELHQELRHRILSLSDVTERQNAGIHENAFFVGGKMFMHIHGHGHCDIQLANDDQERVLVEGKARTHRWAPEAGYVTVIVHREEDLEPAMDLIRMSHRYLAGKQNLLCMEHQ